MEKGINVDVYVICKNEIRLAPFAVQYWKRYARKVYVYDNGSTDGTIEYLSKFPFVEIHHFETDGLNDEAFVSLKNEVWKGSDADFVVVSDFDEFIYAKDILSEFRKMKEEFITVCKPLEYVMLGDNFPVYNENVLSHEQIKYGYQGNSKCLIFDPNKIFDMNYLPGCHECNPIGYVTYYTGGKIFFLHHAEICLDYVIWKYRIRRNQLSAENIKKQYGTFYLKSDDEVISEIQYKRKYLCVPLDYALGEKTVKIFVCTYDRPVKISNDIFVPLQVGKKVSGVKLDCIGDDTGDNISDKNKYYSEQTGVYWVWKNMKDNHPDYVGFCHYRKYPYFNPGIEANEFKCTEAFYKSTGGMNESVILDAINKSEAVCIDPFNYFDRSLETFYRNIHISEDFDILDDAVKTMFPEYYDSFESIMRQVPGIFFPYNIYIMKWELFCKYCEFIFPIFEYMEDKIDKSKHVGYQSRVFGYMAERLLSVFMIKNVSSVITVPCALINGYDDPDYDVQDKK